MADTVEAARQAARSHRWAEAVTEFGLATTELTPDDLLLLGDALWWNGQPEEGIEAFEKAFALLEKQGRHSDAAIVGARLAYFAMRRLSLSIAFGWVARSERLLEGQPESEGHGWLKVLSTAKALMVDNDMDRAVTLADEALRLGRQFANPGIQALALSFKGVALVYRGDWKEGIALVDEATIVATSEATDMRATSDVYCNTIAICHNLGDYRRAAEWTEKAERWMQAHSVGGYPGVCQVHRAELKRLRGSWPEAESDARRACVELERFHIMDGLGFANYEIGEIRRRMGDFVNAEKAFARAYEYGHDAQPGLSLLMRDQGDVEGAARSIAGALERAGAHDDGDSSPVKLARAPLLPAQSEIALAAGDISTAEKAVAELEAIARHFEGPTWEGYALSCRGALHLYQGRAGAAVEDLSRAWRLWQEIGLPYESAQCRMLLGQARRALGDEAAARLEFRAAAAAFRQLGAPSDLRRLQVLLGEGEALSQAVGERVTKVFMFTDIVTSTDLIGLIGDAAWENLLRWHDRTLRQAIAAHEGEEVRHTGDGFFVAFDLPRQGIDCAVQIQRLLRQHRAEHGFALWVRIGLHLAEATREGGDYSGQGVHAAARIGALADREEIVISAALMQAAGAIPYPIAPGRTVTLKGIADPVEVHQLDWS